MPEEKMKSRKKMNEDYTHNRYSRKKQACLDAAQSSASKQEPLPAVVLNACKADAQNAPLIAPTVCWNIALQDIESCTVRQDVSQEHDYANLSKDPLDDFILNPEEQPFLEELERVDLFKNAPGRFTALLTHGLYSATPKAAYPAHQNNSPAGPSPAKRFKIS